MINSDKELYILMMNDLERSMLRLSEKILRRWKELIRTNWYEAHEESDYYERTFEFVNSLVSSGLKKIKNGFEIVIFFDTNLMSIKKNKGFTQHEDREKLPHLIETGYISYGKKFEGAYAFEELISEIKSKNYFIEELRTEFGSNIMIAIN